MSVQRRLGAYCVLILQLFLGMRPFALPGTIAGSAGGDRHEHAHAPVHTHVHTHVRTHHVHEMVPDAPVPETHQEHDEHGEHREHATGCHATPCCAPIAPQAVVRSIGNAIVIAPRVIVSRSAYAAPASVAPWRQPPSTAPPHGELRS